MSTAPISLGCLLRTVCTIVILLVFCSSSVLAQHRKTVDRPASSLTPRQDVKVYRDMTRFLENRLIKLRGIVQRAHTAQRKIRRSPLKGDMAERQKSLRTWQSIERRARAMLAETQRTLALKKKAARFQKVNDAITLTRLDGAREHMSTHRGSVVLLHFWATWCRPCLKEIDYLDQIYHRYRVPNFKVVSVSLDARKKDVTRFMSKKKLRFPVYMDAGRTVYQQLIGGTEVLPRSLLINQDGQIVQAYAGAQHLASLATSTDIPALLSPPLR